MTSTSTRSAPLLLASIFGPGGAREVKYYYSAAFVIYL